jgi:excinuclease ABC subunit B
VTIPQVGGMYKGDRARKENLVNYGFRLPSALDNRRCASTSSSAAAADDLRVGDAGRYERRTRDRSVEQLVRPTGLVDPMLIVRPPRRRSTTSCPKSAARRRNERVLVTTLTKRWPKT